MKEKILRFGDNESLVGILSKKNDGQPNCDYCVIFLNAGLIHKIGPNRLYVKMARELLKNGINSFRFDFPGIGDSQISTIHNSMENRKISSIIQAMDLIEREDGINKFIISGICSGATDAFFASLEDNRINGLLLIDGVYENDNLLEKIYPVARRSCNIRYYKKHLFSLKRWKKVFSGKSKLLSPNTFIFLPKWGYHQIKSILFKSTAKNQNTNISKSNKTKFDIHNWNILFKRNVKIFLIFCEGGNAFDVFKLTVSNQLKYCNYPFFEMKLIKDVDHTFTPVWSQDLLTNLVLNWILKK